MKLYLFYDWRSEKWNGWALKVERKAKNAQDLPKKLKPFTHKLNRMEKTYELFQKLPDELKREVIDYIEFLLEKRAKKKEDSLAYHGKVL